MCATQPGCGMRTRHAVFGSSPAPCVHGLREAGNRCRFCAAPLDELRTGSSHPPRRRRRLRNRGDTLGRILGDRHLTTELPGRTTASLDRTAVRYNIIELSVIAQCTDGCSNQLMVKERRRFGWVVLCALVIGTSLAGCAGTADHSRDGTTEAGGAPLGVTFRAAGAGVEVAVDSAGHALAAYFVPVPGADTTSVLRATRYDAAQAGRHRKISRAHSDMPAAYD